MLNKEVISSGCKTSSIIYFLSHWLFSAKEEKEKKTSNAEKKQWKDMNMNLIIYGNVISDQAAENWWQLSAKNRRDFF